jgi:hypothetical protein
MSILKAALIGTLFFLSPAVLACSFDMDCSLGSKCLKKNGDIDGICAGGLAPGNSNDSHPVESSLDVNGTYGNTCSFDMDCGLGSVCAKSSGNIDGVCLKR